LIRRFISINLSINTGAVPQLKSAKIIAVFKKGNPHSPSNYRPISILSVFSKLLEKVMCKRLYSYLQANDVYHYKFGFRKSGIVQFMP